MTEGKITTSFPDTPEGHALMEKYIIALAALLKGPPKIRETFDAKGRKYILLYHSVVEEQNAFTAKNKIHNLIKRP